MAAEDPTQLSAADRDAIDHARLNEELFGMRVAKVIMVVRDGDNVTKTSELLDPTSDHPIRLTPEVKEQLHFEKIRQQARETLEFWDFLVENEF